MDNAKKLGEVHKMILTIISVIVALLGLKCLWVTVATTGQGSFESEKAEILRRRNFLTSKLVTSPDSVLKAMPNGIGSQFRGEWAIYSCAMLSAALVNISKLYPDEREKSIAYADRLIAIVMSPELRKYDAASWGEDPLKNWDSEKSHMSYLSLLAWMISGYKDMDGGDKYDEVYDKLCSTLARRMRNSPTLNLRTYPYEPVYVPDMLVTIVALRNFSRQHDGRYDSLTNAWIKKAKTEWIDKETGLLKSFLSYDGQEMTAPVRGSYSSLICYYLTFVDAGFAKEQYALLKKHFIQQSPFTGIREYPDRSCWLGMDIDSGPIIFNLSPSGTAFAIGPATYFNDSVLRSKLLRTAEIAGSTIRGKNTSHYLLANLALVGEAITLAMRTSTPWAAQ